MPSNTSKLPEWERVLSSAAHLQRILPDAVLAGGTAPAIYAEPSMSTDADPILTDPRSRFDLVLAELESVAGWKTVRIRPPVQILGSLDGIETGVRQLIRDQPLDTAKIEYAGQQLTVPTPGEMLRIKGVLILKRNATRDYLDFCAMTNHLGEEKTVEAMRSFDQIYPQPNEESALQQLQIQLAEPLPFDLDSVNLSEYKHLAPEWQDWSRVRSACGACATLLFDRIVGE